MLWRRLPRLKNGEGVLPSLWAGEGGQTQGTELLPSGQGETRVKGPPEKRSPQCLQRPPPSLSFDVSPLP